MINWQSTSGHLIARAGFVRLMYVVLGLYGWEIFSTIHFDWTIISRKRKFRWPFIFYFAGRYLLLFAIIGILYSADTNIEVNCQAIVAFSQLAGASALGISSLNLAFRIIAFWSGNKWVIGIIVALSLGHWSLILQGNLLKAIWIQDVGCTIVMSNTIVLAAMFGYSMCFDFVILCLAARKLAWIRRLSGPNATGSLQMKLLHMVFTDGLVYFIVAFLANLTATILLMVNLNATMSIIFNVPAATASTVVASWVVRRLYNFDLAVGWVNNSDERPSGLVFANPQPEGDSTAPDVGLGSIHHEMHSPDECQDVRAQKPSGEDFLSLSEAEGSSVMPVDAC